MKSAKLYAAIVAISSVGMADIALAVTGSRSAPSQALARSIVTVIGSRGNVCTGALIAPNIVLSAAHCITSETSYRVIDDTTQPPRLLAANKVITHPKYNAQAMNLNRATADVALLHLPSPVPNRSSATVGVPRTPIRPGAPFTVVGIGTTASGSDAGVGIARAAGLTVTGNPGALQIRLVDPVTQNNRPGIGACTGDSGAPVFEDQSGVSVIIGVVSWSTGANNSNGCGGLTGVTPLTLYRDWIVETARSWGARL